MDMIETVRQAVDEELVARHVEHFRIHGYAVFEQLFSRDLVDEWHHLRTNLIQRHQWLTGDSTVPDAVNSLVEREPEATLPGVANPTLLEFAERVMGPFVQLDTVVLAGDPPLSEEYRGQLVEWHRDRFGFVPYDAVCTRPLSMVFISYIQEMTIQAGPFRVIPGSHKERLLIEDLYAPHPREVLLHLNPGDIVVFHHNLIHSGTKNTSGHERRYFGFIYNLSVFIQEDNFSGPNCQLILATARKEKDRRLMRLFGADDLIFPRQNSGFASSDEELDWQRWREEDEAYRLSESPVAVAANPDLSNAANRARLAGPQKWVPRRL